MLRENDPTFTPLSFVKEGFESEVAFSDGWVIRKILEAELELESRLGPLHAWAARQRRPDDAELRIAVVVSRAVNRVMRNPSGFQSEADGEYSYSRGRSSDASGQVEITDDDWRYLGVGHRHGSFGLIRLSLPADSPRNAIDRCG